jgi:hypothetical protein
MGVPAGPIYVFQQTYIHKYICVAHAVIDICHTIVIKQAGAIGKVSHMGFGNAQSSARF